MGGPATVATGLMDRAGAAVRRFRRPLRDGLLIVGVLRAAYYVLVQHIYPWTFIGVDARAYWGVDLAHPYVGSGVGDVSTYLYSPAFAQLLAPLSNLPFPVFDFLWTAVLLVTVAWLVRPYPLAAVILVLPVGYELFVGNVHFLIAAAIVLAFQAPGAWAFPILTKITPGIGVGWFVIRREWRALAVALGVTAAIVVVSFAITPSAWWDWVAFLVASPSRSELLLPRVIVAAGLVVLGALSGRRWLIPVAVWMSLPIVWVNSWVILLATIRLREPAPRDPAATPAARP
jgi:Glycosyltransferase family 87